MHREAELEGMLSGEPLLSSIFRMFLILQIFLQ